MSTADKLAYLAGTRTAIKGAIESKGVTVEDTDTFRSYAAKIASIPQTSGWIRPADWLPIPAPEVGTQLFKGLLAVFPGEGNFLSVRATGAYIVDWGDGSVQNIASNVDAHHVYDYSTISDTTICTRGYKQVIVTITPQGGVNLASVNISKTPAIWTSVYQSINWLDVTFNGPSLSALQVGINTVKLPLLERVRIGQNLVQNWAYCFAYCYSLVVLEIAWGANPLATTGMFLACTLLPEPPVGMPTGSITNGHSTFSGCSSILYLPGGWGSNTTFVSFASGCSRIIEVTNIDTSSAITMNSAFNATHALQKLHLTAHPSLTTVDYTTLLNLDGSIKDLVINGCKNSISVAGTKLSATGLNAFFTSLGDGTSKTVTITGALGAATCDRSIATSKGWTVTG